MPTNINPYTGSIEFKGVDYIISDSDPTSATYDGFNVPTISTTKVTGRAYLLTLKDEDTRTATWLPLATGPTDLENFIPDSGVSPVVPDGSGSIHIRGDNGIETVGGVNFIRFDLPEIVANIATNFDVTLGDAGGFTAMRWLDLASNTVASLNSDGDLSCVDIDTTGTITSPTFTSGSGKDIDLKMGDSGGINRVSFRNSGDIQVAWIDSHANFAGTSFDAVSFIESPLYEVASGVDMSIRMGDAVGANFINFQSSTPGTVASLSSTGILDVVNITAGTFAARETVYSPFEEAIITTVGDDNTVSGVSSRKAVYGGIFPTAGDGNSSPQAIVGVGATAAGSHILSLSGCHGEVAQNNTSQVVSSLFGVTGLTSTDEVNAGDLPQLYFFGVHGNIYMDGGAATPTAGEYAGLGAITDYSTPLNSYAYGVVATRRGIGGGAAARAAFGVSQGTVAIPDWLYGLDLYNTTPTTAGQAYTNADIRLWNQATLSSSASGVTFTSVTGDDLTIKMGDSAGANLINYKDFADVSVSTLNSRGDLQVRSMRQTQSYIDEFYNSPIIQSIADTGATPALGDGDINLLMLPGGEVMEQFLIGAKTIVAPRYYTASSISISLDEVTGEGAEYNWGADSYQRHQWVIGTTPAFHHRQSLQFHDIAGGEPYGIMIRNSEANNSNYQAYNEYVFIGVIASVSGTNCSISTRKAGGGVANTDTGDSSAGVVTFGINVSAAGVVNFTINGSPPTSAPAFTFTNAITVMPCIHLVHNASADSVYWSLLDTGTD